MKKLALAVATSALGAYASAATVSEFANGVLVPWAQHGGSNGGTAVGLNSCAAGTVYWTFFDVNTKHVTDGQFDMTADDQTSFIWADESGIGLEGETGYLVFILDTGGFATVLDSADIPCLAGNAFQVNTANSDVAYLPALPLQAMRPGADGDFGPADAATGIFSNNLLGLEAESIASLGAGAQGGDAIYLRYFIADGATTNMVIWSADDIAGEYIVNMFNSDQDRKSVTFNLQNAELNEIDPTNIVGRPADFEDGFIRWVLPTGIQGVFSWSIISAPAFGAVQTVVNPILLGGDEVRIRTPRLREE